MTYDDVVSAALKYSMRTDEETASMMPMFMSIVESRINRRLDVKDMAYRSVLVLSSDKSYYGLPDGFLSMRDIQVQSELSSTDKVTAKYVAPEIMNANIANGSDKLSYTIIADQIQIHPVADDQLLEIVYRKRVQNLSLTNQTNWLSNQSPDVYIFGLLVEISSFSKDADAAALWDGRMSASLSELQSDDDSSRWSGPSLEMELG